jgi:subtilisin family serine protease
LCLVGGHGTAVASIAAGRQYGVAKLANIVPVRVFDCNGGGGLSRVVDGLNWIYNNPPTGLAVVNLSLAGAASDAQAGNLELAIDALVNQRGLTVVVAAGNANQDVQNVTPARHSHANGGTAITVAGTNNEDRRWMCNASNYWETVPDPNDPFHVNRICDPNVMGSNWGTGVDVFAPAQNVASASLKDTSGNLSDTAERQQLRSGTSFSTAIVSGLAARYLQTTGVLNPTPTNVWNSILWGASGDAPSTPPAVLIDAADAYSGTLNGSPNRLVYGTHVPRCR